MSHLQEDKQLSPCFLHEQFVHVPLLQEQVFNILRKSLVSQFCQIGTNLLPRSFQPHVSGEGIGTSSTASLHKYPACKHARYTCILIPCGDGTSYLKLIPAVLRCLALNDSYVIVAVILRSKHLYIKFVIMSMASSKFSESGLSPKFLKMFVMVGFELCSFIHTDQNFILQ